MNEWIKKNRDAILVASGATIAAAAVAGVTYIVTSNVHSTLSNMNGMQMALIADKAGVLDKIVEHQDKLKAIQVV